jgi:hypothetical protein
MTFFRIFDFLKFFCYYRVVLQLHASHFSDLEIPEFLSGEQFRAPSGPFSSSLRCDLIVIYLTLIFSMFRCSRRAFIPYARVAA